MAMNGRDCAFDALVTRNDAANSSVRHRHDSAREKATLLELRGVRPPTLPLGRYFPPISKWCYESCTRVGFGMANVVVELQRRRISRVVAACAVAVWGRYKSPIMPS